jgi:hypothetical protein
MYSDEQNSFQISKFNIMCPQKAYANLNPTASYLQITSETPASNSFLQLNESFLDKLKDVLTPDNRFNSRPFEPQDNSRQLNDLLQLVAAPLNKYN